MTSLFNDIIFGPIQSRRLGLSLGVNLLPNDSKLCNFDCIYCECGWNAERIGRRQFNKKEDVLRLLEQTLQKMDAQGQLPDVITFAGNGEPTLHPDFHEIIEQVIVIRNRFSAQIKISVLSNATRISKASVRKALMLVDNNILKLDSAFDKTAKLINNPNGAYSIADTIKNMKLFEGQLIIQTMFLRGEFEGESVDNTTDEEINAWLKLVAEVAPQQVMIYSLDRDTPCQSIEKISRDELLEIAKKVEALGVKCLVA